MVGDVEDPGTPSLGHRRWLLDAGARTFGSGSTGSTNSLYVVTDGNVFPRGTVPPGAKSAWPPEGFVPWPWVFRYWSVTIGGTGQNASFDPSSQVTVTVDGQQLPVHDVAQNGATLAWVTDVGDSLKTADHDLQVNVTGATIDGQPFPLSYTVKGSRRPRPRRRRALGRAETRSASRAARSCAAWTGVPRRRSAAARASRSWPA